MPCGKRSAMLSSRLDNEFIRRQYERIAEEYKMIRLPELMSNKRFYE
jgi:hypothetical protein